MLKTLGEALNQPLFWLALSIFYFWLGQLVFARVRSQLCNPLLVSVVLMAATLLLTGTPLADYNRGGGMLTLFLTPLTVALAVPIYRRLDVLRSNLLPILAGACVGCVTALVSTYGLCRLFGLNPEITMSLLPKSVTTPIAVRISEQLGGIPALTAVCVIIAGMTGAILLPGLLKLLRLDEPVALGVGIGTAAHAFGTSRALQIGETEGAMSSLALGVAGVFTAVLAALLSLFL